MSLMLVQSLLCDGGIDAIHLLSALAFRRQDEDLDQLSHHVVRIGELGKEMGQELHMQGQMLDELDQEIEGTSTRIAAAQVCCRGDHPGWQLGPNLP
jgi:hypothetical protein